MARKFPLDEEIMGFSLTLDVDPDTYEHTGGYIGAYYTLAPETTDVVSRGRPFKVSKAQLKRMTKLATSKDFIVEKEEGTRLVIRVGHGKLVDVDTVDEDGNRITVRRWYFKKQFCWKCNGTGVYRWTNWAGRPMSGPCFTCKHSGTGGHGDDGRPGKGYVTPIDELRSEKYWERRTLREMALDGEL